MGGQVGHEAVGPGDVCVFMLNQNLGGNGQVRSRRVADGRIESIRDAARPAKPLDGRVSMSTTNGPV